ATLSGPRIAKGGERHAAEGPSGLRHAEEAEMLRRGRAPTRRATAENTRFLRPVHDRQLLLRNRASKERGRPRVHQAGLRKVRGQRKTGRRVLYSRDRPDGGATAPKIDQPRGDIRYHGQRSRR